MKNISVREGRRDDVPALAALGRTVFAETWAGTANPDELASHIEAHFSESAISTDIVRESVRYFMAESGEVCAGLVKVGMGARPQLVPEGTVRQVHQLYVAPDFQRMGVGRRLLDAAVEFARAGAASGVFLSVWSKAIQAISFYEDYGFRALGNVPFKLGDAEYLDSLMWLPLTDEPVVSR